MTDLKRSSDNRRGTNIRTTRPQEIGDDQLEKVSGGTARKKIIIIGG